MVGSARVVPQAMRRSVWRGRSNGNGSGGWWLVPTPVGTKKAPAHSGGGCASAILYRNQTAYFFISAIRVSTTAGSASVEVSPI